MEFTDSQGTAYWKKELVPTFDWKTKFSSYSQFIHSTPLNLPTD